MRKIINQSTSIRRVLMFMVMLFASYVAMSQITYFVKTDGDDAKDGKSWSNAFKTLQKALTTSVSGDKIWVRIGVYFPDEGPGVTNNDVLAAFILKTGVEVYGGFQGTETLLSQRPTGVYSTLSGVINPSAGEFMNSSSLNVVRAFSLSSSSILDGFDIRGVASNDVSASCGMIISGGSPKINNCQIAFNRTPRGAGMQINSASPAITNCRFVFNQAIVGGSGGAIRNASASPTFTSCSFIGNRAENGGAMTNENSSPTITNCVFSGNTVFSSGSAIQNTSSSPLIMNCSFSGNDNPGSAISNSGASSPVITNSILWNIAGSQIQNTSPATTAVTYSIVRGGYSGTGNLDKDPLYVDPVNNNLKLQPCSPAINAGTATGAPTTDIEGNARPNLGGIDMGAYEFQTTATPGKLYVKSSAAAGGDGLTWATAYNKLQDALSNTGKCFGSVQIWVAAGTYYPDEGNGLTDNDRNLSFNLKNNVALYGGFVGTEIVLSQRNWRTNVTTLSGDIQQNFNYNDNSEHVLVANGVNNTALLDGFTVRSGFAIGGGGGMYLYNNASPKISNCDFENNEAKVGGAMENEFSSPEVTNCIFKFNLAVNQGGAVRNGGGAAKFINCLFTGNAVFNPNPPTDEPDHPPYFTKGGAMFDDYTSTVLINCTFISNSARRGDAIYHLDDGRGSLTIKNCIFWDNFFIGISSIYNDGLAAIINYSIVQGGYAGTGNLDKDPLFTGIGSSDFHLQACSPAIDAGDNVGVASTDYDGNTRILNATGSPSAIVDMGAYEFTGTVPVVAVTCPSNFTVNTDEGQCSALVNFTGTNAATATGCSPVIQYSPASGSVFQKGVNTVNVTATDARGNTSTCSFTVTVVDKEAPSFICPSDVTVYTDPASSNCSKAASWSIPTATDNCPGTVTVSSDHNSGDVFPIGNTTVKYAATDASGNTTTCSFTVTVIDKTPPVISNASPSVVSLSPPDHKMRDVTIYYSVTDNCDGTATTTLSVGSNEAINGTGDGDTDPDWEILDNHHVKLRSERSAQGDGRIYTITITATDANGNVSTSAVTVRVAHNITAPNTGQPFRVGSTVSFAGVFWDKPTNKHTANWLIDGNTSVKGTVTEPTATKNGKVTGSYKFNSTGVYKLRMNTTDQNNITSYTESNGDLEEIVVIYDPNGGYTYGGGYFNSPAGALVGDPTATGKASYGFTVNYFKGATYPKGETQFKLEVANFEFNALNFDYLVMQGAKAQFRGTGKITGDQSGYGFIMTVIDGSLDGSGIDKIRMKIFNKNTGQIIYDNQPGAGDAADPVAAVGDNSSVVISGTGNNLKAEVKTEVSENATVPAGLQVTAMPNPTSTHFSITVSTIDQSTIKMFVVDMYGRVIEQRILSSGQTIYIGDKYRPGTYIVKIMQGDQSKQLKLIKLPE
jgi:hypothetical protein